MATRSRIRRSSRRGRVGKREVLWTTVVFDNVSPSLAPGTTSQLVAPVDWVRSGGAYQRGCVLTRIRGWLQASFTGQVTTEVAGTIPGEFYAVVWKAEEEEDESTNDWSSSASYNDEDILWTGGVSFPGATNIPLAGPNLYQLVQPQMRAWDIDIRTKRKLTSDDVINLTVQGESSGALTYESYSGVVRSLLLLP